MMNSWYYDHITNKELEANPVNTVLSHECWLDCHYDCYDSDLMCRCWCHHKHGYAAKQKLKHATEQEAEAKLL
jgi:hypothetical protein